MNKMLYNELEDARSILKVEQEKVFMDVLPDYERLTTSLQKFISLRNLTETQMLGKQSWYDVFILAVLGMIQNEEGTLRFLGQKDKVLGEGDKTIENLLVMLATPSLVDDYRLLFEDDSFEKQIFVGYRKFLLFADSPSIKQTQVAIDGWLNNVRGKYSQQKMFSACFVRTVFNVQALCSKNK